MDRYGSGIGVLLALLPALSQAEQVSQEELLQLDLNQLMQVKLDGAATLTPTATRRMPASITSIDRKMIEESGARSLFDLLEIYVPNFHYLPHHYEAPHMGVRGLISHRDDKYLLVVNGRVLNEKTHFGALSERDMPMLGDIRKIDVVRGPGSVVYGPGAVSMVVNIQTDTFADHGEDGFTVKWGEVEQFRSLEVSKTIPFGGEADHGLWLYGAITDYDGAENADAPLVYGKSAYTSWGQWVQGGEPVPYGPVDNHDSFHDWQKVKLHAHYQQKDFNAWLRYTQGGEKLTWENKTIYNYTLPVTGVPQSAYGINGVGYQQLTLDLSQLWAINSSVWFELKGGYDTTTYIRELWNSGNTGQYPENHREEEYLLRGTLNWNHSDSHASALGIEEIYSRWGLNTSEYDYAYSSIIGRMEPWETNTLGIFGEHQWQMTSWLTNFIGLRADKDQYTNWMWSPRLALVASVSDKDTVKTIFSRSLRKNNAEELYQLHKANAEAIPEKLSSAELSYGHQFNDNTDVTLTGFYNKAEVLDFNNTTLHAQPVGELRYGGLEFEAAYKTEALTLGFSHAWSKLDDFKLAPGGSTRITASHLGYGNDLNNWSNHITKLNGAWAFAPKWQLTGDLRAFWYYQGALDIIEQTNDAWYKNPKSSTTNLTDPGYTDSVGPAYFLDLGVHYQTAHYGKFSLMGYNLLGMLDQKNNKRLYLLNVGNYRSEAAAVALNYQYKF